MNRHGFGGDFLFYLLARADDAGHGQSGGEHRDVALPDLVLAAEAGEAGQDSSPCWNVPPDVRPVINPVALISGLCLFTVIA
jgi:hypothetical protein